MRPEISTKSSYVAFQCLLYYFGFKFTNIYQKDGQQVNLKFYQQCLQNSNNKPLIHMLGQSIGSESKLNKFCVIFFLHEIFKQRVPMLIFQTTVEEQNSWYVH